MFNPCVALQNGIRQGARRVVWLFQISDEQHGMASFLGQPEGTRPLRRDPALQLACMELPHRARCALTRTKAANVASIEYVLTGPRKERQCC